MFTFGQNVLIIIMIYIVLKCCSSEADPLLNVTDTNTNDNNNNDLVCIICMEGFNETDIIKKCIHNCSANFHVHCWEQCIQREIRCPHCRKSQIVSTYTSHLLRSNSFETNNNSWINRCRCDCDCVGGCIIIIFIVAYSMAMVFSFIMMVISTP